MGELRDQVAVEEAISESLTALEGHVAQSVADSEQLRNGMHELRGQLASILLEREEAFRAIDEIRAFMGSFSRRMDTADERQTNLQNSVTEGFRALNLRIGNAERAAGVEEVTQA